MATTNDEALHERLIAYSGIRGMATFPELMWNYRMSELVAAVAIVQLRRAHTYVEQGIAAARFYNEAVQDIPWIHPQHTPSDRTNVFFFQAEDGIRDGHVTGVQTCALPISPRSGTAWETRAAPCLPCRDARPR